MGRKILNHTNQQFGRLLVIKQHPENDRNGQVRWICLCNPEYGGCGNETIVLATNLRSGGVKSCGCLSNELRASSNTTHNLSNASEYVIWAGIKTRCYNKNDASYKHYGGRGITMSNEWKENFLQFYKDMGPRPSPEHSIDRERNNEDYNKDNCRWATPTEQSNNTRRNVYYDYKGERLSISQIAHKVGIGVSTLWARLQTMSLEEAISPVIDKMHNYKGESKSLAEWCRIFDLSYTQVYTRMRKGMLFEEAITIGELRKDTCYELDGVNKTIDEWCKENNNKFRAFCVRLYQGWTFKEALRTIEKETFEIEGMSKTLSDWCGLFGLNENETCLRIIRGERLVDIIKE